MGVFLISLVVSLVSNAVTRTFFRRFSGIPFSRSLMAAVGLNRWVGEPIKLRRLDSVMGRQPTQSQSPPAGPTHPGSSTAAGQAGRRNWPPGLPARCVENAGSDRQRESQGCQREHKIIHRQLPQTEVPIREKMFFEAGLQPVRKRVAKQDLAKYGCKGKLKQAFSV